MPFRAMLTRGLCLFSITVTSVLCTIKAQAQFNLGGYSNSHYAGIHGVPMNPASAAGTHYKWDVNIGGIQGTIGNTYVSFPRKTIFHPPDSLEQLDRGKDYFLDSAANPLKKQYGWGSVDLMMPSVLYSIDELQSIAFTWRIRANGNAGGLTTDVTNFFAYNFPNPNLTNRRYDIENAQGGFNWWNEFGATYARVIRDDGIHRLKGGVTLKLLSGIAAGYAQVEDASFIMRSATDAQINSGTLKMGYSEGINNWEKPTLSNYSLFKNIGFGMDLGVIYEWREEVDGLTGYDNDQWNPEADDYKLRLGVSLLDLGGITYKKMPTNKDLALATESINPNEIKHRRGEGWQQYYRRISTYFTEIPSDDKFRMNTPASLNLMADYNIDGRFFVNFNGNLAMNAGRYDPSKTYRISQFQLTPRYDSRNIGGYVPISVNTKGQLDMGVGLRAGPLVIGSSTLLSNLFQKDKKRMDGFLALRVVPIRFGKSRLGCPATNF